MNITAYLPEADIKPAAGFGEFHVIDAAQSVGKKYPVKVGHVTIIRGFIHYTGDRYSTHKGVEAVISPTYKLEDGRPMCGDPMGALELALKTGIKNGRDDSK